MQTHETEVARMTTGGDGPSGSASGSGGPAVGTFKLKAGLAGMLKQGVIMDVVTPEHARIAEDAGAWGLGQRGGADAVGVGARREAQEVAAGAAPGGMSQVVAGPVEGRRIAR